MVWSKMIDEAEARGELKKANNNLAALFFPFLTRYFSRALCLCGQNRWRQFFLFLTSATMLLAQAQADSARCASPNLHASERAGELLRNEAAQQYVVTRQATDDDVKRLFSKGEAFYARQEYEEALAVFKQALATAQPQPSRNTISAITRYIANCLYALGQYEQALASYRQTWQLQQEAGDQAGSADTWLRLGHCHYALGDLDEAIDHYQQSLTLAKESRVAALMAEALSSIGLAWFVQGENELALEHYYQSLNHYATAGDKDGIAQALQNVGNANFRLQNYRLAFEAFQNAWFLLLESGRQDEAHEVLLAIGLVHFVQNNFPQALEACQQARSHFEASNDKPLLALALYRIGLVKYAENDFVAALSLAERAAALAVQGESHETLWRAQHEIGRAQLRLSQPDKARAAWLQSIATIEQMRAELRGNDTDSAVERTAPYLALVELLVDENNPVAAFAYAERAKAQTLWGILQGSRSRITKTLTPTEVAGEQDLRRAALALSVRLARARSKGNDETIVKRLRDQLQKTRAELATFTRQLYLRHPGLKVYRGEAPPIKASETYALLNDPGRALLEFVLTGQQVLLFVLTRGPQRRQLELNTYRLDAALLPEQVLEFRAQITSRDEGYAPLARALFDRLLKPAQPQLAGKTALTIVPDGILWALPFAALQSGDNRFWLEDCSLSFAGSVSALREMNKLVQTRRAGTAPSLLAIAPHDSDSAWLDKFRLAPAAQSRQAIPQWQAIYGATRSQVQIGEAARETNVQQTARSYSLVQFAAPAFISNYRPLYSFVVLSPVAAAKPKTDLLPLWKLTNWTLRAELLALPDAVVHPVERRSGNGFAGVSWAMFVAGSAAALVSQWQTEQPVLLTALHQQLQLRTPNALQKATIRLLQRSEYRHPIHWAGFVMLGAGK